MRRPDDSDTQSTSGPKAPADVMDDTIHAHPGESRDDGGRAGEKKPYRATVVVIQHPDSSVLGRWFQLQEGQRLTIGRSPSAEICLQGISEISRRHAEIWQSDGVVRIRDLGSANGTLVNGEPVTEARALENGDRIQLPFVHLKLFGGRGVEQAYFEAIHDWATRDSLTKAFNRRTFDEELKREFACVARYQRRVSLVLIDIDGFKTINDQFGHPVGDAVLQRLTHLASKGLRRESTFARVGGDEFAVLCPNTPVTAAVKLAERLRRLIASHPIELEDASISVTCTFGVAEASAEMESPEDLYRAADQSLYAGKKAGKGSIVPYPAVADEEA